MFVNNFFIFLVTSFLSLFLFVPLSIYGMHFIGSPSLSLNNDGSLQAIGTIGQVDKNINVLLQADSATGVFDCDLMILMGPNPEPSYYRSNNPQNGTFNLAPDDNNMISFELILSPPVAKFNEHDSCDSTSSSNVKGINIDRILSNMTYRNIKLSAQYFDDPSIDNLTKKWSEIKIP